jgi:hypothetical protein
MMLMRLPFPMTTPVRFVLPRFVLAVLALVVAVSTTHTIMCWMSEAHYTPSMAARDQAALRSEIARLRAQVEARP